MNVFCLLLQKMIWPFVYIGVLDSSDSIATVDGQGHASDP